jgi:tetratricopeptide (TPR) repeat protein
MFGIDDNPKLLDDAVQDLRAALSSNRRRATTLSALADALFTRGDFRQANETAREAWHADAFLLRPHILMRRFESAFHLEDDVQAAAVCAEEKAMLPRTMWLFCELALRGWSQDRKPDADGAWELVEDLYGSPSTPGTAAARAIPELQIAAILARAGEADSARNVVRRVRGRASYDREADLFAAAALARIGDHVDACAIVSTWLERVPTSRASLSRMRWFRDLPVVANSLVANEGAPPDPRP